MSRESRPQIRLALPDVRNASTGLALASVVMSIVWWVLYSSTGTSLYLIPAAVLRSLALWQPVTWLLVSVGAMPVLFSALILWSIGGSLERKWGRARFLRFVFSITFLSGLITVGLSLAIPGMQGAMYRGGEVMAGLVWVAWGLVIWHEQTNLFGYPLTGRTFAMIGVLLPVMSAVFGQLLMLVPEFIAIALAFLVIRGGFSPSEFWVRIQSARLQRDLKKRSSRLSVISGGDRNMPKDSDKYMH